MSDILAVAASVAVPGESSNAAPVGNNRKRRRQCGVPGQDERAASRRQIAEAASVGSIRRPDS